MSDLTLLCRTATAFKPNGEIDEAAYRAFLRRFIDTKLGVYVGSGGSGEGHGLTHAELRRVYEIGVDECKGKIAVNANPPEQHTARATIEQSQLAADAGVDVVNLYGPASWHGFKPTDDELMAYFDEILSELKFPVALAPNPVIGYTPSPRIIAQIADKYRQVQAINLAGNGDVYFVELMQWLRPDVEVYVPLAGSSTTLKLGATGLLGAEANILPKSFRHYLDLYSAGNYDEMAKVYADLRRFGQFVMKWHSASPRWLKMAMKALQLPGGEGGLHLPYRNASAEELKVFTKGILELNIPEINDRAAEIGLV